MGSKQSSEMKKEENKDVEIKHNNNNHHNIQNKATRTDARSSFYVKENNSSYHGIKSEISASSDTKDQKEDIKSEPETNANSKPSKEDNISNEIKVPTPFFWREGGNMVYITGSFSNWEQWFLMSKTTNANEFSLILVIFYFI